MKSSHHHGLMFRFAVLIRLKGLVTRELNDRICFFVDFSLLDVDLVSLALKVAWIIWSSDHQHSTASAFFYLITLQATYMGAYTSTPKDGKATIFLAEASTTPMSIGWLLHVHRCETYAEHFICITRQKDCKQEQ